MREYFDKTLVGLFHNEDDLSSVENHNLNSPRSQAKKLQSQTHTPIADLPTLS